MIKFNSQICTTIEQSKRLLELGLEPETADMVHINMLDSWICVIKQGDEEDLPYDDLYYAWSLHRLIALCPETIEEICNDGEAHCSLHIDFDKHRNIYNNIIDYIDWLIKKGYFNKEYLRNKD